MNYPLSVTNVSKTYATGIRKTTTVLHNCSLQVKKGEVVSLIGINGAGKTTLLKMLVGITLPTTGSITIEGRSVTHPLTRRHVGYMPENPQFYGDISADTFLRHIAGLFQQNPQTARTTAHTLLALVDLSNAARRPIRTYSKGMRQRLGFAQALVGSPKIVLLDEPLDGLDPLGRRTLKNQITALKKTGTTVIVCSHILSDIAEISDRVGVLHQGTLSKLQTPQSFIGDAPSLEEAFVATIS